jgi:hypothetical protein
MTEGDVPKSAIYAELESFIDAIASVIVHGLKEHDQAPWGWD